MLQVGIDVDQDQGHKGGMSEGTMRGAFMFACQSGSHETIRLLLNHDDDRRG
jgi:hypothetical protein